MAVYPEATLIPILEKVNIVEYYKRFPKAWDHVEAGDSGSLLIQKMDTSIITGLQSLAFTSRGIVVLTHTPVFMALNQCYDWGHENIFTLEAIANAHRLPTGSTGSILREIRDPNSLLEYQTLSLAQFPHFIAKNPHFAENLHAMHKTASNTKAHHCFNDL